MRFTILSIGYRISYGVTLSASHSLGTSPIGEASGKCFHRFLNLFSVSYFIPPIATILLLSLRFIERAITCTGRKQFFMRPAHASAVFQIEHAVALWERTEARGDQDDAPRPLPFLQMLEHPRLRLRIDRCKRIVEHDDAACVRERPREREPCLLAARERPAVSEDFRIERKVSLFNVS